ncbi:hypothetical protein Bhyg_06765 [Pseudolycoriella hygida]|uniref:RRM domain-containing protein n=1 Tax=Pseudolycoriella hygida TaxID=35572 RepID=A0A9Q0S3A4_9DIPT|nr:hypothetical protein Bhyg_06765 [Pseudolycoriella hygida]
MSAKRSHSDEASASPEKKPKLARYLEDGTPIRTIEMLNLPDYVCEKYLRGFFHREGPIENIEIVAETKNDNAERVAYVTFVLPESVAKLLWDRDESEYFPISRFQIRQAPDERQPKLDPQATKLQDVNDFCVLNIMSFLALDDVINLGKACDQTDYVSQIYYRKYSHFVYKPGTGDPSINETTLPNILEAIGGQINSIEWHNLKGDQLSLLCQHCPNVKKLKLVDLCRHNVTTWDLKKNLQFFVGLTKIHIRDSSLYDNCIKLMMSGCKLKTLKLERCLNIRGKFFNSRNRKKLRIVKITKCSNGVLFPFADWDNRLVELSFDRCCSFMRWLELPEERSQKLKKVQLDFTCFSTEKVADLNIQHLRNVKSLTITRRIAERNAADCNNLIEAIRQISSLETLNMELIKIDHNTIHNLGLMRNLKSFGTKNSENTIGQRMYESLPAVLSNLEELVISLANDDNVYPKSLCKLIDGLPKLKYFSYSFMTWKLLEALLQFRMKPQLYKRNTLRIGVAEVLFTDPKKAIFDSISKGNIILSVAES